jgi:hypothetical protein
VLGLAAACAFAPDARGQAATPAEPGILLVWTAPEECPKQPAVVAEVARHAPEAAAGVPGFSARGSVTRADGTYRLELETLYGERRGSRHMQDASCTELTRAAAVVIALAIRPEAMDAAEPAPAPKPAPAQPEPAAPPPPALVSSPPSAPPAKDAPRSSRGLDVELWAGAAFAGELGTLPGFAPGVTVGIEARTEWLRAVVSGEFLPAQRTTPEAPADPFLALDYFGADALGCVGLLKERLAPGACAGAGVGRLRARSRQAPTPGEGATLWVTPRFGLFALYRALPALTLEAGVHVRVATKETSFTVENFGPVYETEPLALHLGAGASVRIW